MTERPDLKVLRVMIEGRVQGVGFRYWVYDQAGRRGLDGWVRNLADGRVEALFAGPDAVVEEMISACWKGPTFSRVRNVTSEPCNDPVSPGFDIIR